MLSCIINIQRHTMYLEVIISWTAAAILYIINNLHDLHIIDPKSFVNYIRRILDRKTETSKEKKKNSERKRGRERERKRKKIQ